MDNPRSPGRDNRLAAADGFFISIGHERSRTHNPVPGVPL
jgi:hypothetical protein